jgi:hypothetical protein
MIKRILHHIRESQMAENMFKLSSFLCMKKKEVAGLVKIIGAGTKGYLAENKFNET